MLKDFQYRDLPKCWICRLLFLALLAFFALSPFADAYSDSLCSPFVFLNGQFDSDDPVITDELNLTDALSPIHTIKTSEKVSQDYHALLQASIKYGPACFIEVVQISTYNIKSSQVCPPVISDLPPPVI